MKTLLFAVMVILTISSINGQDLEGTCDPSTGISDTDCEEFINIGAIAVIFEGQKDVLTDVETEHFQEVIANMTNNYVYLEVLPEHVIIVQRIRNTVTNDKGFNFFILNPSRSEYMPVALRKQELYLMIKINNEDINNAMGEDWVVTPIEPESTYPLAIPAWAIAIIGYVGLLIFIYCTMVLTSDWRKQKAAEFEANLEKEYYANTNGVSVADEIPLKKMAVEHDYQDLVHETKKNGGPSQKSIGVQTPRHVAVQVDPEDVVARRSSPAPSQTSTTEVVIENGYSAIDHEPAYDSADAPDTAHTAPVTTEGDADKEADDAAAAIEGAVNEGYAEDEPEPGVTQPSTNL
ncbi:uncharacterized protein LOC115917970 [Strongylocentrotus purpuratus]|uniref:Uncharacterized protein n=1 Tax=Strongylocentrotus purpuratus TaxID=7668 RepID=A0A7M7PN88_STRPU|nr:uncharacterized protein LOC115917970 [Strongylocentrotus purpuratus]|eukprot:XP_003729081.1 PREDICTED: uncharacterized protein LOC100890370 [Strongylocentrotus purpuratus]